MFELVFFYMHVLQSVDKFTTRTTTAAYKVKVGDEDSPTRYVTCKYSQSLHRGDWSRTKPPNWVRICAIGL